MGMFDYVDFEAPCLECGDILRAWQSKSALDNECSLRNLQPWEVANFYDVCYCRGRGRPGIWYDYDVEIDHMIFENNEFVIYNLTLRTGDE